MNLLSCLSQNMSEKWPYQPIISDIICCIVSRNMSLLLFLTHIHHFFAKILHRFLKEGKSACYNCSILEILVLQERLTNIINKIFLVIRRGTWTECSSWRYKDPCIDAWLKMLSGSLKQSLPVLNFIVLCIKVGLRRLTTIIVNGISRTRRTRLLRTDQLSNFFVSIWRD